MPDFAPIEDYVTDEWYPVFAPSGVHSLSTALGGRSGTA